MSKLLDVIQIKSIKLPQRKLLGQLDVSVNCFGCVAILLCSYRDQIGRIEIFAYLDGDNWTHQFCSSRFMLTVTETMSAELFMI